MPLMYQPVKNSYLCFSYIDFPENYPPDFKPDDLLEFFSESFKPNNLNNLMIHNRYTSPLFYMVTQAKICSKENFEERNKKITARIATLWKKKQIPSTITRYVFKLNLSEDKAKILLKAESYAELGKHIIGRRQDTITQTDKQTVPTWMIGTLQKGHLDLVEKSSMGLTT